MLTFASIIPPASQLPATAPWIRTMSRSRLRSVRSEASIPDKRRTDPHGHSTRRPAGTIASHELGFTLGRRLVHEHFLALTEESAGPTQNTAAGDGLASRFSDIRTL